MDEILEVVNHTRVINLSNFPRYFATYLFDSILGRAGKLSKIVITDGTQGNGEGLPIVGEIGRFDFDASVNGNFLILSYMITQIEGYAKEFLLVTEGGEVVLRADMDVKLPLNFYTTFDMKLIISLF